MLKGIEKSVLLQYSLMLLLTDVLSFAYEFENGLSFEARYTGGLTNVIKEEYIHKAGSTYKFERDNKNEVFMLTVGYKFEL